jgi:hypothetical protein
MRCFCNEERGATPAADGPHRDHARERAAARDSARRDHGRGRDRVHHLGQQRERADAARVAARLGPLRHDEVGAALGHVSRGAHVSDQRQDLRPLGLQGLGKRSGRAEPRRKDRHLFLDQDLDLRSRVALALRDPVDHRPGRGGRLLPLDAEVVRELAHRVERLLRNSRLRRRPESRARCGVDGDQEVRRQQKVDPERLVGQRAHLGDLGAQHVRGVRDAADHAESTRLRDRGGQLRGGDGRSGSRDGPHAGQHDRVLDAECITELGT